MVGGLLHLMAVGLPHLMGMVDVDMIDHCFTEVP